MIKKYFLLLYIILRLILHFFIANIYGIGILFISLYFLSPHITDVQPFNLTELIIWSTEQSDTLKALLVSSLVTVIGFIIAFQSTTKNWKDQLVANIRVQASNDIDDIYTGINELINSINLYVDDNLKILSKIKNNVDSIEIHSGIRFVLSRTERFLSERQELSLLLNRAFQLYSRYSTVLFATQNTLDVLERINKSVSKVTHKMWILAPTIDINNAEYLKHYLDYVDEKKYKELSLQCKESYSYISTMAGFVRGKLTANIYEFNLSMLFNIIRKGKLFVNLWSDIKKIDKKYRTNG